MDQQRKVMITTIVLVLVLALAGYFIWIYSTNSPIDNNANLPSNDNVNLVGNDRDDHDCIGSAGYSWCESKQKCLRIFEEFCSDVVSDLVDNIKQETDVTLTPVGENTFNWLVRQEETIADAEIVGVRYSAENVTAADYQKIEDYMNENYEPDSNNVADGVTGGLRGYYGDYMVCNLNFRHAELAETDQGPSVPVVDNLKVTLDCGYFNKNNISNLIATQLIKEDLAEKYQKAVDEVHIDIRNMSDAHAAGSVAFGEGGPGETGIFLAIRQYNSWEVVFDGNGSVNCKQMREEYKFPAEILEPSFCDPE